MVPRRYAGYKLAGLPLENITRKVKEAAAVLQENATPLPKYTEIRTIPGTASKVYMEAVPASGYLNTDSVIEGNPNEIQKIINAKPPGVLTLAWDVEGDGNLSDKQRFAAARIAQKEFKTIFNDVPNGTIVQNSPIGGLEGDYTRADAYMTQGMGPLQRDGQQYAIINNGVMEPVSPFTPLQEHAEHLAKRSKTGGQLDISNAIEEELAYRRDTETKLDYEEEPQDYNDDPGPTIIPYDLEFKDNVERSLTEDAARADHSGRHQMSERGRSGRPYLPEIAQRNEAKRLLRGQTGNEYLEISGIPDPTPDQIGEFRDEQARYAGRSSALRSLSDQVEQVYQRPSPPILSINDWGTILQDRRMTRSGDEYRRNLTEDDRRTLLRDRVGGIFTGVTGTGDEPSSPTWMRQQAGQRLFTDQRSRYIGGPWVNQNEPNSPQMIQDMRAYQLIGEQANPYLEGPMREYHTNRASTNPDIPMAVQINPLDSHTPSEFFGYVTRTPDTTPRLIGPRVPPIQSREFPPPPPRRQPLDWNAVDLVDSIRDELGLRRRSQQGATIPDTDDIPF